MHPIVIIAHDKSPAINKAVEALEEAGLEVRVLNTAHAKLVDFLGALAGEDEEPPAPPKEPPPEGTDQGVEPPPEEVPAETTPKEEPVEEHCVVGGERIRLVLTDGVSTLSPSAVGDSGTGRLVYQLNESSYAFWVTGADHHVELIIDGRVKSQHVTLGPPSDPPTLHLNRGAYEAML